MLLVVKDAESYGLYLMTGQMGTIYYNGEQHLLESYGGEPVLDIVSGEDFEDALACTDITTLDEVSYTEDIPDIVQRVEVVLEDLTGDDFISGYLACELDKEIRDTKTGNGLVRYIEDPENEEQVIRDWWEEEKEYRDTNFLYSSAKEAKRVAESFETEKDTSNALKEYEYAQALEEFAGLLE